MTLFIALLLIHHMDLGLGWSILAVVVWWVHLVLYVKEDKQ